MSEEPPDKKQRCDPKPPLRPPEGQSAGEGIAVVADRMNDRDGLEGVKSAFRKRLERIDFKVQENNNDLKAYLESFRLSFMEHTHGYLTEHRGLKVYLVLTIGYRSQEIPEREPWIFYLGSEAQTIYNEGQILESTARIFQQIETKNDHLVRTKTGLIIDQIHWSSIFLSQFTPLIGESFKELPKFLKSKHAIINVKNTDNRCFGYSILAHFHPVKKNPQYPYFYNKFFADHALDTISYPVEIEDIPQIEEKLKVAINVFSFFDDEGKARFPRYISKYRDTFKEEIDLLYWNNHFAYIKSFSAFIADLHYSHRKKEFCKKCFGFFIDKVSYDLHSPYCNIAGIPDPIFIFPEEHTTLSFANIRYMQAAPFVIYADFECLLFNTKIQSGHMTEFYSKHIPCSVAFKVVCQNPTLASFPLELHSGPDSPNWFLQRISEIEEKCIEILYDEKRMIFTEGDKIEFNDATHCYLCKKVFLVDQDKVRDHDHLTGIFRGAAHSKCNLMLRKTNKIPIFFHNFRGYDSHLVAKGLTKFSKKKIHIIGQGLEKYLTLSFGDHAIFKDSYQFLAASLEQLAKNLFNSGMKHSSIIFKLNPNEK